MPISPRRFAKVRGSGRGWRPFLPVLGADRSSSRWTKRAPGICDSAYARRPALVSVRSWRQSQTIHAGSFRRDASSSTEIRGERILLTVVLHRQLAGIGAETVGETQPTAQPCRAQHAVLFPATRRGRDAVIQAQRRPVVLELPAQREV